MQKLWFHLANTNRVQVKAVHACGVQREVEIRFVALLHRPEPIDYCSAVAVARSYYLMSVILEVE